MNEKSGLHKDVSHKGPSIILSSGRSLYYDRPDPIVLDPEVIAHSISKLCRWTGHCLEFFSVAQHCVLVSRIVPPEHALAGLMHDASEAFVGDVNRPLKWAMERASPGMFRDIEDRLHAALAERYGFQFPFDESVMHADSVSLSTEKRDILPDDGIPWIGMPPPIEQRLRPVGPKAAYRMWMDRYAQLTKEEK
jgi:hypothetical protein